MTPPVIPITKVSSDEPSTFSAIVQGLIVVILFIVISYFLSQIGTNPEKNEAKAIEPKQVVRFDEEDQIIHTVGVEKIKEYKGDETIQHIKQRTKGDEAKRRINGVDSVLVKLAAFENHDYSFNDEVILPKNNQRQVDTSLQVQKSRW